MRADAEFCCNEHKVEYFNWKRPASRKRKAKHGPYRPPTVRRACLIHCPQDFSHAPLLGPGALKRHVVSYDETGLSLPTAYSAAVLLAHLTYTRALSECLVFSRHAGRDAVWRTIRVVCIPGPWFRSDEGSGRLGRPPVRSRGRGLRDRGRGVFRRLPPVAQGYVVRVA